MKAVPSQSSVSKPFIRKEQVLTTIDHRSSQRAEKLPPPIYEDNDNIVKLLAAFVNCELPVPVSVPNIGESRSQLRGSEAVALKHGHGETRCTEASRIVFVFER
jgi:hypothetical protein